MRRSYKGEVAIPKEVWLAKASTHRDFAAKLSRLLAVHTCEVDESLAQALRQVIDECNHQECLCLQAHKATKRGRPKGTSDKKIIPSNQLAVAVAAGKFEHCELPNYDSLTFAAVEVMRQELAETKRSKPTVKAAIDYLNAEAAREFKKQKEHSIKVNFEAVHSAYKRGKKLSQKKSKPII